MEIGGVNNSSVLAPVPKQSQLGQEDFLALMIAQFQNQDPFKPMENGEFLGQMAQFSSVAGLQELNARFDSLAEALSGDQSIGAARLIGHQALIQSNSLQLEQSGERVDAAIEGRQPGGVRIDVTNAGGQLVRQLNVAADSGGINRFHWDGLDASGQEVAAGEYRLNAYAQHGGQDVEIPLLLAARIDGVALGGSQGTSLNVRGLGEQPLASVRQIIDFGTEE